MVPKILLIFLPVSMLVLAILLVAIWDGKKRDKGQLQPGNGRPEGAFRAFYHALWILLLWSGLSLSFPLWFSYRARIEAMDISSRWVNVGKIAVFPMFLLILLRYGARRGYLKWIDSLSWPDKENQ